MALIPDFFREEILQEEKDANGVMFENANKESVEFALGFDIDGDQHTTRLWFYNCTATRPTVESSTTEDSKEPTTDKITVSCAASEDGIVRAKTTAETADDVYNNWYKSVYKKVETTEGAITESETTEGATTESETTEGATTESEIE